ncbi:putative glutamate racemase [Lactobacillus iners LactinV 01V1-a]|uniref:Putative glutamate racemase n=1 Tax=Lactobacillus iners LactinV 01V1-a TaxID=879297 RepID=E1NR56_9LACO|nr:putative glutamate racemase [Lactobacillus iners LactinV 01V1-a]
MDNRPIGILDSGLGGLTVLKKVIQRLPNESTIFIGDQAHMPYGDRTVEDIINLTRASVKFLLTKNVKVIILVVIQPQRQLCRLFSRRFQCKLLV